MGRIAIIVVGALVVMAAARAEATQLRIHCQDENGRSVHLSSAELLVSVWGGAPRVSLDVGDSDLILPLDPQWLQSRWPHPPNVTAEDVSLLLRVEGYAAMQSEPFAWLGSEQIVDGAVIHTTEAEVRFPRHRSITVRGGTDAEIVLKFRRPVERRLRLIDDRDGSPLQGVQVQRYLFWSASNHCGYRSGADELGRVVSDAAGYAPVPDGDIRYAFEFAKPLYVLEHPTVDYLPTELRTRLSAPDTVVQLHRWRNRPLRMHVTMNGKPAQGKTLMGRASGCPGGVCAACDGEEGTSDANGMIDLPEFYPESRESVYFEDSEQHPIWKADPNKWPGKGTIEVDLGVIPDPRATAGERP